MAAAALLLPLPQHLDVEALLVHHVARRVRAGDYPGAELLGLVDGVDGHVAGTGDDHPPPVQRLAPRRQHVADEEDAAVAGGLGPDRRATPSDALAGQGAGLV